MNAPSRLAHGLILVATLASPGARAAGDACPDLSGHYRISGDAAPLKDALAALRAPSAGAGGELKLADRGAQGLALWVRRPGTAAFADRPDVVLERGVDYECKPGWIELRREPPASRKQGEAWLEGQSRVRVAPGTDAGLRMLEVRLTFQGRERVTLYSYDSARVSAPKPGTGTRLDETIRWREWTPGDAARKPDAPEPASVAAVRRMLDPKVLGSVRLATLTPSGEAVRVVLKAPRSKDAAGLEERLRAASIRYEVKVKPIWSENAHHMELLVWPRL